MAETTEHKHEEKKESKQIQINKDKSEHKKTEATVNGRNLAVGIKHAVAVCNMIRGKEIDRAIAMLEEVVKMKRAVPMRGEIPHRRGMMSGRYPVKASGIYLTLLKSLKANAIANDLELEKFRIICMPNNAPRPYRRFGTGRFKRTHVLLKLVPLTKHKKEKQKKNNKEKKQ